MKVAGNVAPSLDGEERALVHCLIERRCITTFFPAGSAGPEGV
jgi:hypothetical protein